jgi:hypothetical protein
MLTYCSFANESTSPLQESLAYPLVSLYFSLRRVSLAEYFLVLRVLFPLLLQMVRCTTVIASTTCTLWWVTTRTKGMVISYVLSDAFGGHDYLLAVWHCIWTKCVCVILKLFASATLSWTWFVITLRLNSDVSQCCCELYVICDCRC